MEMNRRAFLKGGAMAGALGVAALGLSACGQQPKTASSELSDTSAAEAPDWLGAAPIIDESDIAYEACPVYTGMRPDIPCWLVHLYNSAPYIRGCSIKGAVVSD